MLAQPVPTEQPPPVKKRTIFLSEHSTEERMAFRSNQPHPTLDECQIKEFSKKEWRHSINNEGRVESDKERVTYSYFVNQYEPGKWVFKANYRNPSDPYYASDVTILQQTAAAQQNGFTGTLPSLIIRENIQNATTLEKTEAKSGEELLDVFLGKTHNGKSTQRILNEFGLKAIKVEQVTRGREIDFHIHVRPTPRVVPIPEAG